MTGWLSDLFRLGWGALFWNARKTWHLARGRRGACPCQIASDSGRAGETGCEAIVGYRSPARFRTVCPLLTRRAEGTWVCSVNSEQVRPFWGRATLLLGGSALSLALVGSLAVFALLRGIGYEVRYTQVAWPPAWREFRGVQAAYYLARAREAQTAGNVAESILYLNNAYELDPRDVRTGLLLAQLWQVSQPVLSDQTYARVFAEHPAQRPAVAQAWFRALLARGDFPAVQRLAGQRLLHSGAEPSAAWAQAFLFASRRLGDSASIQALLDDAAAPAAFAPVLGLERDLYAADSRATRVAMLTRFLAAQPDAFATYHALRRLLQEARADLVLAATSARGGPLGDREKTRLRLDALADLGRGAERTALVNQLLALPTHPAVCELLSSHLIARPDATLLAAFAEKLAREPLPDTDARYPQLLAFFAACGVHRDTARIDLALQWINTSTGRDFRALAMVRDAFVRAPGDLRPERFLPVLQPIPLEVAYALHEHYAPPSRLAP